MLASIRGDEMKGKKAAKKRRTNDNTVYTGAFTDNPYNRDRVTWGVTSHGSAPGERRIPARILRILVFLVAVIAVAVFLSLAGGGSPPTTPPALAGAGIPTMTPPTIYVTATPFSELSTEMK